MTHANERLASATPVRAGGNVPRHVAIIMDGNGRWAAEHGLPRTEGHRRGLEAVRRTVTAAQAEGIDYLTLFSFSSENWTRPLTEVEFLFGLVRIFIRRDLRALHAEGVRVSVIGGRDRVPRDISDLLSEAETMTAGNRGLRLVVAFNYGGRDEITRAVRTLARKVRSGEIEPDAIDEAAIAKHLDTAAIPDPDLIVRTSGELRLSNFLLWQAAYAELVFLPVYWPDFGAEALRTALDQFALRRRRYGGLAGGSGA